MKKEMILTGFGGRQTVTYRSASTLANRPSFLKEWSLQLAKNAWKTVDLILQPLNSYYAKVLERNIQSGQTLVLLNAQTAFVFMAFGFGASPVVEALFVAWFASALLLCKRMLA